ncbi:MAG: protein kinase domain-containing protein [Telluria sp.]
MQAGDIIGLEGRTYTLREQLGGSSYGLVWSARAPDGQDVAVKLVNRAQMEAARAPERRRWIESAAAEIAFLRSLSAWDGRHIVRLLAAGEHDGLPVLVLERLDGDLARHAGAERNAGRALAVPQVLDWIAQVNQAVAKVHQYGWRYLDLKPANLLLDAARMRLKLADFGTNRLLADTEPHSYAGTANWQAPEQFFPTYQHTYDTDARTDYFSLGALFYFLVTGVQLQFCTDCGAAYREHRTGGAYVLREANGRAIPPTLRDEEAALFLHRIDRQAGAATGLDRMSWANAPAAGEALALLRALLAPQRADRPRHALDISRRIGKVRQAWDAQHGERAFFASLRVPASFGGAAGSRA